MGEGFILGVGSLVSKKALLPLVLFLFIALFSLQANALSIDMPSSIELSNKLAIVPITISNDSNTDLKVVLSASFITSFELPSSIEIDADDEETVNLSLYPLTGFTGQKYLGQVYFSPSIGSQITKELTLVFAEPMECPASIDLSQELVEQEGMQLIRLDLNARNDSVLESITLGIDSIKDNSRDIEFHPAAMLSLEPLSEGSAIYFIKPVYSQLAINLKCNDFLVSEELDTRSDSNYFLSGIGLVSLGASSLFIDIGLAIIVVLLLIAFVARLVKMHQTNRQKGVIE